MSDTQINLDKIKGKLEKLLRLQEGAEKIGSLEEAANAAQKIQTLLFKYNLQMADIPTDDKSKPEVNTTNIDLNEIFRRNKSSGPWMENLVGVICRHNLCRSINMRMGPEVTVMIFGLPQNVQVVEAMIHQLINRLKGMVKLSWKEYHGPEKKNSYHRGYLSGAVSGIDNKLWENAEKMKEENSNVTTLVVTNEKIVNEAVDNRFGDGLRVKRTRQLSAQHGRMKGFIDGKSMNLHKELK